MHVAILAWSPAYNKGNVPRPQSPFSVGVRLKGGLASYRISKEIGRGGTGLVFACVRSGEDEPSYAAKIYHPSDIRRRRSPQQRHRFMNEATAIRELSNAAEDSPIVHWIDGGEVIDVDGHSWPFYIVDRVPGDLARYMGRQLTKVDKVELSFQLCECLAFLELHAIVHRDLKPANLLVTAGGRVLLSDLGIAKLPPRYRSLDVKTHRSERLGNWKYWPPEVARREPLTHKSDLYALGLILGELWLGYVPRGRGSELLQLADYFWQAVWLHNIVSALLADDPTERPESSIAVIDALERFSYSEYVVRDAKIRIERARKEELRYAAIEAQFSSFPLGERESTVVRALFRPFLDGDGIGKLHDFAYELSDFMYFEHAMEIVAFFLWSGVLQPLFSHDETKRSEDLARKDAQFQLRFDKVGVFSGQNHTVYMLSPFGARFVRYVQRRHPIPGHGDLDFSAVRRSTLATFGSKYL